MSVVCRCVCDVCSSTFGRVRRTENGWTWNAVVALVEVPADRTQHDVDFGPDRPRPAGLHGNCKCGLLEVPFEDVVRALREACSTIVCHPSRTDDGRGSTEVVKIVR